MAGTGAVCAGCPLDTARAAVSRSSPSGTGRAALGGARSLSLSPPHPLPAAPLPLPAQQLFINSFPFEF